MAKSPEQVAKFITEIEASAYEKGWRAGIAAVMAAANKIEATQAARAGHAPKRPKRNTTRPRQRAGKGVAQQVVQEAIKTHPNSSGTEIARLVAKQGVNKHTVRTSLRRLRMAGAIVQRDKRWFPAKEAA